jgi:beta-galactosidase
MPKHNGPWHPEEWQGIMHEAAWDAIIKNPTVWGSFVWNMYDFASDWRNEGDRLGINDKGLVTWDRKTPKDTYFFYKANWTPDPLVYITSRRFVNRSEAVTPVKIYTNAPEAELFVNGKSLGKKQPDSIRRITWENVTLQPGKNDVEVKATKDGKTVTDTVAWTLGS